MGQKTVSAAQAGIFCVLLPVSTALTGVLALDEHLSGIQIIAFVIAIAGILLATLPARRSASVSPSTLFSHKAALSFDTTAVNKLRHRFDQCDRIWLFGYGSLIFKADFPYSERRPASIRGWTRRFWQGSHDHRGTPSAPGRVLTLTPQADAVCAGMAYLITPEVFDHLDYREKNGYLRLSTDIIFEDGMREPGLLYIADADNAAFLGPASEREIARQIATAVGPSGRNRDYLTELANALRQLGQEDPHVFEIEQHLHQLTR
jgi:cation transport regulator ChaC